MNFIRGCIRNPVAVTVGVILVALFGILALLRIPIQLTPDVDIPLLTVTTRWAGRSPLEIEREITYEQERFLKNVAGVVKLTSESQNSQAVVTLEFKTGMELNEALIRVQNALTQVPSYPDDADRPVITSSGADENAIAWIVLKGIRGQSPQEIEGLRDYCENVVKPEFERVENIARSNIFGGRERELRVTVDSGLLAARGLTFFDIRAALARDNTNVSGGDLEEGKRRYDVRVVGEFTDPSDVAKVVVARRDDVAVRIGDVATVELTLKKREFFVRNVGVPTIAMNATRETGSNVLTVMRELKETIRRLNDGILADRGLVLEQVYDETEYVEAAIARVRTNILLGAALAAIVLWLFLRSLTSTFVVCLAIPICAVGTFLIVTLLGRTINVVMLAGISFAVGMVVDNAIVVLENIHRRRQEGDDAETAAIKGASEVYGAVVASTLTTLAIFLPVIFNDGEVAQLFRDIAIAISAGVALSLVVSLTVIPTYAMPLMRWTRRKNAKSDAAKDHRAKQRRGIMTRFAAGLATVVRMINARWWLRLATIIVIVGVATLVTVKLLPDTEYLPTGNRNLVFGILLPPPGYNVDEIDAMGATIEQSIEDLWQKPGDGSEPPRPAIRNFFFVGSGRSAFMGASAVRPEDARDLVPRVQGPIFGVPGLIGFVQQTGLFGRGLAGGRTIDVDITGPDLDRLVEVAGRVYGDLSALYPRDRYPTTPPPRPIPSLDLGNPELRLVPDPIRMSELGLRNADLGFVVDCLVDGSKVSDYRLDGEEIDLTLTAKQSRVRFTEDIGRIVIAANGRQPITIGDVARVEHAMGPEQINHIERDRAISIQVVPPEEVPLETAMRDIRERVIGPLRNRGEIDSDVRIELRGTADKLEQTKSSMTGNFVLAVIVTYLLLAALFGSFVHPLVIMFSVPLAWVGGVIGLALTDRFLGGQKLDVLTMLGFIILIGIVVNNAILIVHRALAGMRERGLAGHDAVAEAVESRTRPIVMSVMTSILGMLPLVVAPGAGSELYKGLGAVVVGGLFVSAVFTIFLVPALFTLMVDIRARLSGLIRR